METLTKEQRKLLKREARPFERFQRAVLRNMKKMVKQGYDPSGFTLTIFPSLRRAYLTGSFIEDCAEKRIWHKCPPFGQPTEDIWYVYMSRLFGKYCKVQVWQGK